MNFMKTKLKVLVVEDDEDDFFLLTHYIKDSTLWELEFTHKTTYDSGLEAYNNGTFQLCFLDHYLGAKTGVDFLNESKNLKNRIPIILLTGLDNVAIDAKSIELGAADYIPKSRMTQEVLERSIRHSIERHKQNELLLTEREKYRDLFHNSIEAIFLVDENYKIVEGNSAFWEFMKLEVNHETLLNSLFFNPSEFSSLTEFEGGNTVNKLNGVRVVDALGQELIINVSLSVIGTDEEGKPNCYQGVIYDVTELREAQLRSIETEKFNLTGRMARLIGHEVRNPLTNIILATEELKLNTDLAESDDAMLLEMIQRSSKRIETLTSELLNSTKLLDLNKSESLMEDIVAAAVEKCQDRFVLKKIALEQDNLDGKTVLDIDKDKFEIALVNIIINATEAMSETENPKLRIKLTEENKSVLVSITDNGKGMSRETVEKIYDPFFSDRNGGLGLGMTNVKNVMIQHKALLTVKTKVGEGTTFTIKVPKQIPQ